MPDTKGKLSPQEDIELRKHKWELLKKYANQIAEFAKEQADKAQTEIEDYIKGTKGK